MAGAFGTSYQEKLMNYIFGKVNYGSIETSLAPSTLYLALFSDEFNEDSLAIDADLDLSSSIGDVKEISTSGTSYGRVAVTNNDTVWDGSGGQRYNASIIYFPSATASWGTIKSFAVMDSTSATTGDHIIAYGNLNTYKTIESGDICAFNIGNLVFNLD